MAGMSLTHGLMCTWPVMPAYVCGVSLIRVDCLALVHGGGWVIQR